MVDDCMLTSIRIQIEANSPATKDQEPQVFPDTVRGNQESVITCILLTPDFLIYSTDVRLSSEFDWFLCDKTEAMRNCI